MKHENMRRNYSLHSKFNETLKNIYILPNSGCNESPFCESLKKFKDLTPTPDIVNRSYEA